MNLILDWVLFIFSSFWSKMHSVFELPLWTHGHVLVLCGFCFFLCSLFLSPTIICYSCVWDKWSCALCNCVPLSELAVLRDSIESSVMDEPHYILCLLQHLAPGQWGVGETIKMMASNRVTVLWERIPEIWFLHFLHRFRIRSEAQEGFTNVQRSVSASSREYSVLIRPARSRCCLMPMSVFLHHPRGSLNRSGLRDGPYVFARWSNGARWSRWFQHLQRGYYSNTVTPISSRLVPGYS